MNPFKEKLIRDKLPGYRRIEGEELHIALLGKLLEEVAEAYNAESGEELAGELVDIIEVCHSLAFHFANLGSDELYRIRIAKFAQKGGFYQGVLGDIDTLRPFMSKHVQQST